MSALANAVAALTAGVVLNGVEVQRVPLGEALARKILDEVVPGILRDLDQHLYEDECTRPVGVGRDTDMFLSGLDAARRSLHNYTYDHDWET